MHSRGIRLSLGLLFAATLLTATAPDRASAQSSDHEAVIATIETFFNAFNAADSTGMYAVLDRGGRVVITMDGPDGNPSMRAIPFEQFVGMIASPREAAFKETWWAPEVRVEENLAAAWIEYNFWVGEELSHCGNDHFHSSLKTMVYKGSRFWNNGRSSLQCPKQIPIKVIEIAF